MPLSPGILKVIAQACYEAEHPKGMSTHSGKAVVAASHIRYLLAEVESLRAEIRLHEDRWIKTVTEEIAKQDQLIQENVELRKQLAEARLVLGEVAENMSLICSPELRQMAAKALAKENRCQCDDCQITPHQSDCAVHNMPALPKGECDCGAVIICSGCGGEINPDYGKCRGCD